MLPCLAICRGVYIALVYDMIDPCGNERIRREKYQEGRGDRRPATYSAQPLTSTHGHAKPSVTTLTSSSTELVAAPRRG